MVALQRQAPSLQKTHPLTSEVWALFRKARHLEALSRRCTFYERHEILDAKGDVVERHARGVPFVLRKGLGSVPIDPEMPSLDDGSVVSQTMLGYPDSQGRWHRVVQYRRLPGGPTNTLKRAAHTPSPPGKGDLAEILSHPGDLIAVFIHLRDREELPRLPARALTGLAFTEHHRYDHITPLRNRMREANRAKRKVWAGPVHAWLRSIGGRVQSHMTVHWSVLAATIPRRRVAELMDREEVERVELRATEGRAESADPGYLCAGDSSIFDPSVDHSACSSGNYAFMDAHHAATGASDYIDAGYDGAITGGLANWSWLGDMPTLAYGIRDRFQIAADHPAFVWVDGTSRFLYVIDYDSDGTIVTNDDMSLYATSKIGSTSDRSANAHITRCAAIAMADNTRYGRYFGLATEEAREARSGLARSVAALASIQDEVSAAEMLDMIAGGLYPRLGYDGIDVISSSASENAGTGYDDFTCPTTAQACGQDTSSQQIVRSFLEENVIFTKAAGNENATDEMTVCGSGVEVSAPGASAAAITSGALFSEGAGPHPATADTMQEREKLRYDSNGGNTSDGRTYPALVVVTDQCGCATFQQWPDLASSASFLYEPQVKTSGIAPRIAGSTLLFKHWYLETYGSLGNVGGFLMVNLLNFADGYARVEDSTSSPTPRTDPPYSWWGLGRFRMRLFSKVPYQNGPHWGTSSATLLTGFVRTFDITDGRGKLPVGVRHLRVTAWWLEVNTWPGESKAHIRMTLYAPSSTSSPVVSVETSTDRVLRLQFDRQDTQFPCPPSGEVILTVEGVDVPDDERYPDRSNRTVFVSYFWETGDDSTEIQCADDTRTSVRFCTPRGPAAGAAHLSATRRHLDSSIRDTLRIATGIAPSAGTSPVGVDLRCG